MNRFAFLEDHFVHNKGRVFKECKSICKGSVWRLLTWVRGNSSLSQHNSHRDKKKSVNLGNT